MAIVVCFDQYSELAKAGSFYTVLWHVLWCETAELFSWPKNMQPTWWNVNTNLCPTCSLYYVCGDDNTGPHGACVQGMPSQLKLRSLRPCDAYVRQWTGSSLNCLMACRLLGTKPLSEPMLTLLWNIFQWNFIWNSKAFIPENAFENVVCKMASIWSRHQCVN